MTAIFSHLEPTETSATVTPAKFSNPCINPRSRRARVSAPPVTDPVVRRRFVWNDDPDVGPTGKIGFTGIQLAHVDSIKSRKVAADRWTEIDIYRTNGSGKYIWHRVGRSVVAHDISCPQIGKRKLPGFDRIDTDRGDAPVEKRQPCAVCLPDIPLLMAESPASLAFEEGLHTAIVFSTAFDLADYRNDVEPKLLPITEWALKEVSYVDPLVATELKESVEEVD